MGLALFDLKGNSSANDGAIIGSVFGACLLFADTNKRNLEPPEKRTAFFGMWAIDIVLELIPAHAVSSTTGTKLTPGAMLFALGFVGVLHGVAFNCTVGLAGKQYAKQVAKERLTLAALICLQSPSPASGL